MRGLVLIYSILAYFISFAGLAYIILWMAGLIPGAFGGPLADITGGPWVWNVLLLLLFGVQHSLMARSSFKQVLTRYIPVAAERSTYVLASGLAMLVMMIYWSPMPQVVWEVETLWIAWVLFGLFVFGWNLCFVATFGNNHFDLFGVRQAYIYFKGEEYKPVEFGRNGLYKWIRHPIQTGVLIGVWANPMMRLDHLLLSAGLTIYIFIGLWFEERDLIKAFGDEYRTYKAEVGGLIPKLFGK